MGTKPALVRTVATDQHAGLVLSGAEEQTGVLYIRIHHNRGTETNHILPPFQPVTRSQVIPGFSALHGLVFQPGHKRY